MAKLEDEVYECAGCARKVSAVEALWIDGRPHCSGCKEERSHTMKRDVAILVARDGSTQMIYPTESMLVAKAVELVLEPARPLTLDYATVEVMEREGPIIRLTRRYIFTGRLVTRAMGLPIYVFEEVPDGG